MHLPDAVTPVEEILATFDDLVRAGKILYGGLSNFPAWRVAAAATTARLRGSSSLVGVQSEYSLVNRAADQELLPAAEAFGLGACLYAPLGGGLLTGKYRQGTDGRLAAWGRGVRTEDTPQLTAVLDTVVAIAGETGATAGRVETAWLMERAARSATALVPVIGPRTTGQLHDYLAALKLTLSAARYRQADPGQHHHSRRRPVIRVRPDAQRFRQQPVPSRMKPHISGADSPPDDRPAPDQPDLPAGLGNTIRGALWAVRRRRSTPG